MQDEASEGTSSLRNRLLLFFKKIRKNRSCMKNIQHITYDEKKQKGDNAEYAAKKYKK